MKKSIFTFAIFLGALSIMLTSCEKDILTDDDSWGGTYELLIDGKVVKEGSTEEVGMFANLASVSEGEDFGILVANVPGTNGGVTQINDSEEGGVVTITGRNLLKDDGSDELYLSMSGSIKRVSSSKITFEGTLTSLDDVTAHTFSGTMESNAFKLML
jgi:hypothetical protein